MFIETKTHDLLPDISGYIFGKNCPRVLVMRMYNFSRGRRGRQ